MNCVTNDCIFNTITEIDDENIKFFDDNDIAEDNNDNDKIPVIFSISQLFSKYHHSHVSFLTLLKIILKLDVNDESVLNDENIYSYFHQVFLPKYNIKNTISIV